MSSAWPSVPMAEKIERVIQSSSLQWTFLRPGMFAGNALRWWAPQIRAGIPERLADLVDYPRPDAGLGDLRSHRHGQDACSGEILA